MKPFLAICFFFIGAAVFGQFKPIPNEQLYSYHKNKEALLNKAEVPEEYLESYASDNSLTKFNLTFYHKVLYGNKVLPEYIRSILKRLDPDNPEVETLDIFITNQTKFNAFTIADGSIYINIAALADMNSEAELAYLIAHEFAHYKLSHVRKGYLQRRKYGRLPKEEEQIEIFKNSQYHEFQADSLGYKMAYDAGYDSRAMDLLLQKLLFLQRKGIMMAYKDYRMARPIPTTHPITEDRLVNIKKLNTENNNGLLNPSGEDRFKEIKKLAEYDYLKALDESEDILTAISYPLKRYLLTNNEQYLPVMIRATRKAMLLLPDIKKKPFMSIHFPPERFGFNENVFSDLFSEYPDSAEVEIMNQHPIFDNKRLIRLSFDKAFEYFVDIAIKAGYQEPLLDRALHKGVKSGKGKTALTQYLKKENNLYYEYAKLLKEKKLMASLEEGDNVILFGGLKKYEIKKEWVYHDFEEYFSGRKEMIDHLEKRYAKRELNYKIYDYLDFVQNRNLGAHMDQIERMIYSGYSDKLLEYDPRIYYGLKEANIKNLECISLYHINHTKRLYLKALLLPNPLWPFTAWYYYAGGYKSFQNLNNLYYYRLGITEDENLGSTTNTLTKLRKINKKRAANLVYELHKETRKRD